MKFVNNRFVILGIILTQLLMRCSKKSSISVLVVNAQQINCDAAIETLFTETFRIVIF